MQRRKSENIVAVPIRISDFRAFQAAGWTPLEGGDASQANSDFFQILVTEGADRVVIVCPTFLRGPLLIEQTPGGAIAY